MDPRLLEYLGVDPALAIMVPMWATAVKKAIYPAVRLRRRDEDAERNGSFFVPARLQWLVVSAMTCIASGGGAFAMDKPIMHWVSAGGLAVGLAMGWHTSRKR